MAIANSKLIIVNGMATILNFSSWIHGFIDKDPFSKYLGCVFGKKKFTSWDTKFKLQLERQQKGPINQEIKNFFPLWDCLT